MILSYFYIIYISHEAGFAVKYYYDEQDHVMLLTTFAFLKNKVSSGECEDNIQQ